MPAATQAVDAPFLDGLRQALNHLYDLDQLRSSPLISLFAIEGQFSAGTKLQHILLDAIQAMRPPAAEPASSMRRRIHQVLQLRYEQQFEQKEIAVQLGLSVRQYRRLQHAAVEALAFYLMDPTSSLHVWQRCRAVLPAQTSDAYGTAAELPDSLQWMGIAAKFRMHRPASGAHRAPRLPQLFAKTQSQGISRFHSASHSPLSCCRRLFFRSVTC